MPSNTTGGGAGGGGAEGGLGGGGGDGGELGSGTLQGGGGGGGLQGGGGGDKLRSSATSASSAETLPCNPLTSVCATSSEAASLKSTCSWMRVSPTATYSSSASTTAALNVRSPSQPAITRVEAGTIRGFEFAQTSRHEGAPAGRVASLAHAVRLASASHEPTLASRRA